MKGSERVFGVLAVFAAMVIVLIASGAFGAGGGEMAGLNNRFDLGDISAGYDTYWNDGNVNLYAYLNGQHKITSSSVSFYPNYWYTYDDQWNVASKTLHGYVVSANISGEITTSLALSDVGSHSQFNSLNARGISLNENTWLGVYKSNSDLTAHASSSVSISNFDVSNANGWYNEYSYDGFKGGADVSGVVGKPTYFSYSVSWYGDFLPGTVPDGFVAPAMSVSTEPVPEPSTWAMLFSGVIGVAVAIRRRLM